MRRPAPTFYSPLQIALHWGITVLIAAAFFTHEGMGQALRQRIEQDLSGVQGTTVHVVIGGLALVLILWRAAVRLRRGAPEPQGTPVMMAAARWGHRAIYALMIATPVLGIVAWQGKLADVGEVHEFLGQALVIVALGHAAVAIWHAVARRDGTMRRMMRPAAK